VVSIDRPLSTHHRTRRQPFNQRDREEFVVKVCRVAPIRYSVGGRVGTLAWHLGRVKIGAGCWRLMLLSD